MTTIEERLSKFKNKVIAMVDLKKDIRRFEVPDDYEKCYWVQGGRFLEGTFYKSFQDLACFEAGLCLPRTVTEEDKEKRLDLLKKAYET